MSASAVGEIWKVYVTIAAGILIQRLLISSVRYAVIVAAAATNEMLKMREGISHHPLSEL